LVIIDDFAHIITEWIAYKHRAWLSGQQTLSKITFQTDLNKTV